MKKCVIYMMIIYGLSSCNKNVLDKAPLNIISDAVVWNDPAMINAYLANCYADMGFISEMDYGGGTVWFAMYTQQELGDECTSNWNWIGKSFNLSTNHSIGDWWGYPVVRKLNIFLENIVNSPIDSAQKKKRIAEARFLRAFAYFNMVKRYGGVPLITKSQSLTASKQELYPKRDNEQVIYDFILSEIDNIINDLPDIQVAGGRATKYAALALESRVAMYAGSIAEWGQLQLNGIVGIPANKSQEYWQKSYDASQAIINSGKFVLYNKLPNDKTKNFRNIFLDENNQEVIFSEIFNGASGKAHSWDMLTGPFGYNAWGAGGTLQAYLEMAESFENKDGSPGIIDRQKIANGHLWTADELFGNKDPRFRASILTQGGVWLGDTIQVYKGIIKEDGTITQSDYKGVKGWGRSTVPSWPGATPFMILKYLDESIAIAPGPGTSKTDWIVFRYAEILLNYAEAAFELGKPAEALDAINQIRDRAGIALLTSIDRQKIRQERKVELAFEGNRYFDLRRWRTAVTDLSIPFSGLRFYLDYNTRKFKLEIQKNQDGLPTATFNPRNYYLPITLARINNNSNLVENPGYN